MRVYFISNNGIFPHQDTIDSILQKMFDDETITTPSCTYVGSRISNHPERLLKDINELNCEYKIVYYNQDVNGWRTLPGCDVDKFIISLNNEINHKLLTGEILTKIIDANSIKK